MLLFNQAALLNVLGWSLFNSLWQMGLFWLVYVMVVFTRKKISAAQKHSLALFFLAAGTVTFAVTFILSLTNDQAYTHGSILIPVSAGLLVNSVAAAKFYLQQTLPFASVMYLLILSYLSVRYFLDYRHTKRIRKTGLQKISPSLRMFVQDVAIRLGIKKKVQVWISSLADSPVTVGFLKPVILLPIAVMNNLSVEQTEAILLHELAHIRRNDYLVNLLVTFAELIFFFNPFARLLIRQTKTEREYSCDDSVIDFKFDAHLYASALLQVAKQHNQSQQFALAAGGKCRKNLLHRIKRLHQHPVKENYYVTRSFCVLLMLLIGGSVILMRPQQYVNTLIRGSKETPVFTVSGTIPVAPVNHAIKIRVKPSTANHQVKSQPLVETPADALENEDAALTSVSNEDAENADKASETITAAVAQDNQDFSMQPSTGSSYGPERSGATYPFIPSSSYSYQVLKDTAAPQQLYFYEEKDPARESLQNALKAIDAIDWNQIRKTVKSSLKKTDMEKLRGEIRRSLAALDWKKMQGDVDQALSEVNTDQLKSDIKIQLDALRNLKNKNREQSQKLQHDILRDQLKLRQQIDAQQKEMQRSIEALRKKSKVIYI